MIVIYDNTCPDKTKLSVKVILSDECKGQVLKTESYIITDTKLLYPDETATLNLNTNKITYNKIPTDLDLVKQQNAQIILVLVEGGLL
jgi:hypothetical protein